LNAVTSSMTDPPRVCSQPSCSGSPTGSRLSTQCYFAFTLDVMDAITLDAILN
jgi:hypothetical protein